MQTRARPPAWLWFNLLSLDAPLIAVVWQDFLARCYPTVLHATGRCTLGLTVWAIYLADRLLDVRYPAAAAESIRHQFYRRHRAFALSLLFAVAGIDVLATRLWLLPAVFDNGLLVMAGVVVYLGVFPFTRWGAASWKKPLAAALFTAGTFVIAWTGSSHPVRQLGWPAAAFCALCLGNLRMIGRWSHQTIPPSLNIPREWIWVLFLAACAAGVRGCTWFTAISFSAAGLLALARWGRKISGEARCVLADALLLTPWLFR